MTLLKVLKHIRANPPVDSVSGICEAINAHVNKYTRNGMDLSNEFRGVYIQWPLYSGCMVYPVPSPSPAYTASDMYLSSTPHMMWSPDHPYGALRLELLDWCINFLEQ